MLILIANSLLLGVGLAMDAFSVSIANGLEYPHMRKTKVLFIAFVFAFFQALMPLIGWVCVHFVAEKFEVFSKVVPYIAFVLLSFIGGKMIFEAVKEIKKKKGLIKSESISNDSQTVASELQNSLIESENENPNISEMQVQESWEDNKINSAEKKTKNLGFFALFVQGIATSIDALSVGFTISKYDYVQAIICAMLIALVTFVICLIGVLIGKKIGNRFTGKAEILGGIILIAIGLEILIKSFL